GVPAAGQPAYANTAGYAQPTPPVAGYPAGAGTAGGFATGGAPTPGGPGAAGAPGGPGAAGAPRPPRTPARHSGQALPPEQSTAQIASRRPQEGSGEAPTNPDDYAPATEPPPLQSPGLRVKRGTEAGVPLYSQLATAPGSGIPELRLDLHAWDE